MKSQESQYFGEHHHHLLESVATSDTSGKMIMSFEVMNRGSGQFPEGTHGSFHYCFGQAAQASRQKDMHALVNSLEEAKRRNIGAAFRRFET
jgi:hypothetical protein